MALIPSVFAAITITPSVAPGTFDHAVKLELSSSDPTARMFYSFNPDGWPNDALAYTGAILLKSSTSLVYFGFVSVDNESKVLIDDYVIEYPNVSFSSGYTHENNLLKGVKIMNTTDKDLDLSYWEVRTQDTVFSIPENTLLKPTETYTFPNITLANWQAALLMSPDGDEKDILISTALSPEAAIKPVIMPKKKFARSVVRELAPEIWIKPKLEAPSVVQAAPTETIKTEPVTPVESVVSAPTEPTVETPTKAEATLADNLKVAVGESDSWSSKAAWVVVGIIAASASVIVVRLVLKK